MKNRLLIILILTTVILDSCSKNNGVWPPLNGIWSVVSDSTYSSGIGPLGTPSGHKYVGTATDYFKFDGNKLSIKEGSFRTATATYTVSKDTLKLNYSYLDEDGEIITNASDTYMITESDGRSLKLTSFVASPGGVFRESVILSR